MDCSTYHSSHPACVCIVTMVTESLVRALHAIIGKGGEEGGRKREGKICKSLLRGCTAVKKTQKTRVIPVQTRSLMWHRVGPSQGPGARSGAGFASEFPACLGRESLYKKVSLNSYRQCWVGVSGDTPSNRLFRFFFWTNESTYAPSFLCEYFFSLVS